VLSGSTAGTGEIGGAIVNGSTGSTGLKKEGSGTWTLSGANTYSGATTVSAGTLSVASTGNISSSSGTTVNGGTLIINGSAGQVVVNTGGSLGGSGTVGAVNLNNGSFLKPGNSPGNLTAASSVWNGGATYEWQIASLSGVAGTNWDLFTVNGTLDLSSLSASSQFNLALDSAGVLAGFDGASDYSWTFAKATGLTGVSAVAGTDITSLFAISTALFNAGNGPQNGFQVLVGDTTGGFTSLKLVTASVPEPSTPALLMFGLAGLLGLRTLRRKA
jgi:autotransporter-associated beta strand protein